MRIYIGVSADSNSLPLLSQIYQGLSGHPDFATVTDPQWLHFSLAYLDGDITPAQIQHLSDNLTTRLQTIQAFEFELTHLSLNYPMHSEPEWVMYFIKKSEALQNLYLETIRACREAGTTVNTVYDFLPHITVAKILPKPPQELLQTLHTLHDQFATGPNLKASQIKLVQSSLTPTGAANQVLATIELA